MSTASSRTVPAGESTEGSYRWIMFVVYYVGVLSFGATFQSIPPLLPFLIPDLNLSYAQAGGLMGLYALPGLVLAIPLGLWIDRRRGGHRLVAASYLVMIAGTLVVATSNSYTMLVVGRIVVGVGGMAQNVMIVRLIAQWFRGKELGLAMGFYSSAFPLSTVLSLGLLGSFASRAGWPAAVLVGGAVTTVGLVTLLLFQRTPPGQPLASGPKAVGPLWRKTMAIGLPTWLVGLTWFWFNAAVIAFLTFGPDYFNTRGYGHEFAGFMASLQMLGAPVLGPLVGLLLDRYPRPELFVGISGILVAISILATPLAGALALFPILLLAVSQPFTPASIFFLTARVPRSEDGGLAFGISVFCLTAGMVAGPYLVGLTRDASGSYEIAFVMMAVFAVIGSATAGALKILRTQTLEGLPIGQPIINPSVDSR